ncbi:MAG: acetylglutamate kinase [Rhodothermales bacterium]
MYHTSRPTVIKIGGALLRDEATLADFWPALKQLASQGPVVLVHGGGPQSTAMARRLGHEPTIVQGRRVTSDLDLSILHWTICGELNTNLVARAIRHGINAVGLTGIDGGTLQVHKRPPWEIEGEMIDFGWVGDVKQINPDLLNMLISNQLVPIVAPLGIDASDQTCPGQTYNVNADTVAHAIAVALHAGSLLLVTDSGGVRKEADNPDSRIAEMDKTLFDEGAHTGWIRDGMLVKLKMAFEARDAGISDVHILAPDDIYAKAKGTSIVKS